MSVTAGKRTAEEAQLAAEEEAENVKMTKKNLEEIDGAELTYGLLYILNSKSSIIDI
jgi:hypothetical protein